MSNYVIVTDSTCDISDEFAKENELTVLSLRYILDGREYVNYLDCHELPYETFYSKLRNGSISSTSQLNSEDIIAGYTPILEAGNDILAIGFSSGLSGTINSMRIALDTLKENFPERTIIIVDSLCASMGEGLFVWYATENKRNGMSILENEKALLELRPRLCHWFTVTDIDFLKRGGRVSGASAFVAKAINIKPVLHVDDQGHLINVFKKIGRKSAINELVHQMDKHLDRSYKQTIFISHGDCIEEAQYLEKLIRSNFEVENVIINHIGPVIGSHSGPGTLALFFVGDKR